MQFKKPLFWDYKKPNLISNILLPLTIPIKISNYFLYKKAKKRVVKSKQFVLEIFIQEEQEKHQQ